MKNFKSLKIAFKKYDNDNDNKLSYDEFFNLLNSFDLDLTKGFLIFSCRSNF
jgi:Ca2+-binding EF-hand superfamily protein